MNFRRLYLFSLIIVFLCGIVLPGQAAVEKAKTVTKEKEKSEKKEKTKDKETDKDKDKPKEEIQVIDLTS